MKTARTNATSLRVRDLELSDIPALVNFAPKNWNMALDTVFLQHAGRSYFHGRVAVADGVIRCVGQGITTGRAGWVGNIIVSPKYRNRGIGTRITVDLVNQLHDKGCNSLILIATVLGEPVYYKLGFRKTHEYVFFKVPQVAYSPTAQIRRLERSQWDQLFELDAFATGEVREQLLAPHLDSAWAHIINDRGRIDGFFLPSFGSGLVIATHKAAGVELLGFKHALYPGSAVVPAGNAAAIRFLIRKGAKETSRAPRMVLGGEVVWRPECVFARATGYCG